MRVTPPASGFVDPLPQDRRRFGQLDPVVDPHDLLRIGHGIGDAELSLAPRRLYDVGQVVFPLGIVVAEIADRVEEESASTQ